MYVNWLTDHNLGLMLEIFVSYAENNFSVHIVGPSHHLFELVSIYGMTLLTPMIVTWFIDKLVPNDVGNKTILDKNKYKPPKMKNIQHVNQNF